MSIDYDAVCRLEPYVESVARTTGVMLGALLGELAPTTVAFSEHGIHDIWFGSAANVWVSVDRPGMHEFAGSWLVSASVALRSELSKVLALLMAANCAISADGRWDESSVLSPKIPPEDLVSRWVQLAPTTATLLLSDIEKLA